MKRRLPKGEETLPVVEVDGKFLALGKLKESSPGVYQSLLQRLPRMETIPSKLLIQRVAERIAQGRVATIYRLEHELAPDEQLRRMNLGDEIGLELIEAERKLLEEELRMIREG